MIGGKEVLFLGGFVPFLPRPLGMFPVTSFVIFGLTGFTVFKNCGSRLFTSAVATLCAQILIDK